MDRPTEEQTFEGRPKDAGAVWVLYRRYVMTHILTFSLFAGLSLWAAFKGAWYAAVGTWGVACFLLLFLTLTRVGELALTDAGVVVADGRAGYGGRAKARATQGWGVGLTGTTLTRDNGSIHFPFERRFNELVLYDARGARVLLAADTRVAYGARRGVARLDDLEAALVAAGAARRTPAESAPGLEAYDAELAVAARKESAAEAAGGLWLGIAIASSVAIPAAWLMLSANPLVPPVMATGPYSESAARLELAFVACLVAWMAFGRAILGIPSNSIMVGDRLFGDRLPFRGLWNPTAMGEIRPEEVRRARIYRWGGDPDEGDPVRYVYVVINGRRGSRASFYATTLEGREAVRKDLADPEEKLWGDSLFAHLLLRSGETQEAVEWLTRHKVAIEEINDSPDEIT